MVVTRTRVGVAVCVGDRRDVIDTPEVMPTTRRGIHDYRSVVNGEGGGSLGLSLPTWLAFHPTHPSQQRIATKAPSSMGVYCTSSSDCHASSFYQCYCYYFILVLSKQKQILVRVYLLKVLYWLQRETTHDKGAIHPTTPHLHRHHRSIVNTPTTNHHSYY